MTTITNNELTDDVLEYVLAVVEDRYENRKSNAGEDDRIILALRELQKRRKASKEPVRYLNKFSGVCVTLEQQPNASDDVAVYAPLYAAPPASEREQVRREHAEWSDKTFGDVGPIGPLKHLSKEALEAAADPSDPLEWADMQFLLWDAQRRMGISDEFITRAMIEKLEINKSRQWPEPKDGEPRLHIKKHPAPVVRQIMRELVSLLDEDQFARIENIALSAGVIPPQPVPVVPEEIEPDSNNTYDYVDGWNACRAAMLQGAEPVSQTYELPELIEGMEVSVDVSTCDFDAGHRYFGTVTEVSELDTAKNGYILLVQDAEPNFDVNGNSPVIPESSFSGLVNSARALLDVLYEFGADEVAISEYVTNLEDALRVAAAPQQEVIGIDLANGKDASVEVVIENGKVISHG